MIAGTTCYKYNILVAQLPYRQSSVRWRRPLSFLWNAVKSDYFGGDFTCKHQTHAHALTSQTRGVRFLSTLFEINNKSCCASRRISVGEDLSNKHRFVRRLRRCASGLKYNYFLAFD